MDVKRIKEKLQGLDFEGEAEAAARLQAKSDAELARMLDQYVRVGLAPSWARLILEEAIRRLQVGERRP